MFGYFYMAIKKTAITLTVLSLAVLGLLIFSGVALGSNPDCQPQVSVTTAHPFWENYGNYLERKLTVDESLRNVGNCLSCQMQVVRVETNQGVTLETPLPLDLGNLPQTASGAIRVHFRIPVGVSHFNSRLQVICDPRGTQPLTADQLTIDPPLAWANEGCPLEPPPELAGKTLPDDQVFGARLYTATLKDEAGNPLVGQTLKWHLSNTFNFRILDSTTVTNAAGQITALVTPPQYFVCVIPYYDKGMTEVRAVRGDGLQASGAFVFTRCAPPGSVPPWLMPAPVA